MALADVQPRRSARRSVAASAVVCLVAIVTSACGISFGPDPQTQARATGFADLPTVPPQPTTSAPPAPVVPPTVAPRPVVVRTAARPVSRPGPLVTGQIQIPRIGLVATTYEGNTLDVINYGPSHWPGTAMPGQVGNAVFAGHRVTHTHPFLNLDLLQPGDQVVFTTAAGTFVYAVDQTIIVTPDQLWIVDPTPTATFTLFGCHPKHQKTHRIVVRGHLVAVDRNVSSTGAFVN